MNRLVDMSIHVTDGRTHAARADGYLEDPKIRRKSVTLPAAGPRLARTPALRAGVLQLTLTEATRFG